MRRTRYSLSLFALAALVVPIDAAPGQAIELAPAPAPAAPDLPLPAMLAAGLALGLARGKGSVRRPARRRPG